VVVLGFVELVCALVCAYISVFLFLFVHVGVLIRIGIDMFLFDFYILKVV
jgi:hypothetical protein